MQGEQIDVSGLDAIDGGDIDAFCWLDSSAFSNTAGELGAFSGGGQSLGDGDANGDGVADFTITTKVLVDERAFIFG